MSSVELKLFDPQGNLLGSKSVSESIFACDVIPSLLHQVVRWQRAAKRAGTHCTKTRAEMSGGGRKPWRQKGTGRARSGSNTSSIWVGGGVSHGPKPRSYEFSINKKERKRALCGGLSLRTKEGRCVALSEFGIESPKTKQALAVLRALGVPARAKALVVASTDEQAAVISLRNLCGVKVLSPQGLNLYDLLDAKYLILTERGLDGIEQRLNKGSN